MRSLFLLFASVILGLGINAQTTMTMTYGGQARQYLLYVPTIYNTQGTSVPLLFSLHGMGDNMQNFSGVGFHQIADTANFIVVTPQALTDPNPLLGLVGPAWNSGASMFGLSPNVNVDDAGFLMAILDTLSKNYLINPNRVYATGFSMGAYMTHRLACEKSDRIAAVASVAGTIGVNLTCSPNGPIPVLHFHGTADQNVSFTGNQSGLDAPELVDYWVGINGADTGAIMTAVPDIASDGLTIDHYLYPNPTNGAEVEFYKVNGADHVWLFRPANDISYSQEIWRFLSQYDKIEVGIEEEIEFSGELKVWPNPLDKGILNIDFPENFHPETLEISDLTGQVLLKREVKGSGSIELENLAPGIYILLVKGKEGLISQRIVRH